jgi:hypothetical protein
MRRAAIVLVGLLSGCVTKALWSTSSAERPPPEPAGKAECELDLAAPAPGSRSLSFAVGKPVPKAPKRMSIEMGRGRTCLLLRRPLALAFAGTDLVEGRTGFAPERVTVSFAQTRTKQGTRRSPALLQIEGPVPAELRARIERCEDPGERQPLDDVVDPDVRMRLGHAIDTLVGMVTEVRQSDVVAWRATEGPGDWRDALDEAHRTCSVAPLVPYRVVVRVWRNGGTSCYRMRLEDVVLAANITFRGGRYEWNGLWVASLELPEGPARGSAGIPSRLEYAEYNQEGKSAMADVWRVLLTPAAVAADLGLAGAASWADDWLESQDEETSITRPRR